MLTTLASATRVVELAALGAEDLERAVLYLTGSTESPVLVVRDGRAFPALDPALETLGGRRRVRTLDRVVPNPRVEDIMEMAAVAREDPPALVIGVGGGSSLDSAKAVALMVTNAGDLEEYLGPDPRRSPGTRGPKLLLLPTTTGTGSEVTRFGVYAARSGRKYSLASPGLQADAALLVAAAVKDIPPPLLAATAYDAITHALETLWNRNATPLSDGLATESLTALLELTPKAHAERLTGRSDSIALLLSASCSAGAAFNITGTAAIHALSFILSEEWHQPHGAACAFFTDAIYARNLEDTATRAKLARVARATRRGTAFADDREAAAWLGDSLIDLRERLGLPGRFADIGVGAAELGDDRIALLFDKVQSDQKLKNNIVSLDAMAVRALIEAKLG